MGRALCLSLALLFLANVNPSKAQSEAASATTAAAGDAALGGATEVLYDLRHGFSLTCSLPNENNLEYVWKKNDTNVEELAEMKDRLTLERGRVVLKVTHAAESDFGNYSCALPGAAAEQRWAVRGRPVLRQPANTNVVEGQKLKLLCKVTGKPYPVVSWSFSNESRGDGENDTRVFVDVAEALGGRANLTTSDAGVPQGALELTAAQRSDAGTYRCSAPHAVLTADTVLRVKDMYAALWPFLGICAEVFVLCAIILVYEKRRTKPELDDSDTDNHDQKKS